MGDGNINHNLEEDKVHTLIWDKPVLKLIDQRKLPFREEYVVCNTYREVASAIRNMTVRGAPAIGVTAAYGVAIASLEFKGSSKSEFISYVKGGMKILSEARPTAVNLFWAIDKMERVLDISKNLELSEIKEKLIEEAESIERQDLDTNIRIGESGKNIFSGSKKKSWKEKR